ncbi:PAS-domain containing protein [Rubritepida flocculans]|uniref:PAS-domain containing protein n=1 Tax=Rubritepida flocculans TaxID=182403 RepID=UPI000413661D|nr:PAS-domain containing protein [Rubritepida flocculans]
MTLEAAWDLHRGVLAALPLPLLAFDAEGRLFHANPALHEAAGTRPCDLPPGLGRAETLRRLAAAGLFGPGRGEPPEGLAPGMRFANAAGRRFAWAEAPLPGGGQIALLRDLGDVAEALEAAEREARDIQAVLDRLGSGVAVYGPEGRLRLFNATFPRLVGLPASLPRPGLPFQSLLEAQIAAGDYRAEDVPRVLANLREGRPPRDATHERERANGRVLRIRNQGLPDGGWLAEVLDITAERRAEQEARQRAAMQEAMLEALPVGVAVYGPDRVLRFVNAAYNRILADTPARVGEHLRDILTRRALAGEFGEADPEAEVAARLERVDRPLRFEWRRPNGAILAFNSVPLPDGGHAVVVTDISELSAAQAEARARAEQLATTLETTRHGIAMFDAEGRVVLANRLAAHFCDVPAERFVPGVHVSELRRIQFDRGIYERRPGDEAALQAHIHGPLKAPDRYRRPGPGGTVVEVITDPLPGGGFVRSYSDVTALVRAEEEASARAATLQTVLDSIRHGVILYDEEGYVRVANALGAKLAGLPPEAVKPGVHFDTLRDMQAALGEHGEGPARDAYLRHRVREPWKGDGTYIRRRPDGTMVEVRTDLTPGGGCVRTFTDITPLAAAQAELAQRNAMMRAMLENMRHGIALFDAEHRLIAANRLIGEMMGVGDIPLGTPRAEITRLQAERGEFGEGPAREEHLRRFSEMDWNRPHRYRRTRPDGTELEGVVSPVPGGGFVLTLTDITERVRAEAEIERRAAMLAGIVNAARQALTLFDAEGRVIAANDLAAQIAGFRKAEEIVGLTHAELVAATRRVEGATGPQGFNLDPSLAYNRIDRSRPVRYQRRRADGRVIEVSSDPAPGGGYVVGIADITELVEAREAAQRRAEVLSAALNATRHTITLYDRDQRVVATNRFAAELAGFENAEAMVGLTLREVLSRQAQREHPDDPAAQARFLDAYLGFDRTVPQRYQRRHPDGRVFDVQSDPTPDGGFAVSVADVTELVRAQEEAERRALVLQAMIDNNRHGIVLYDREHRLVAANALAGELMGVPDLLSRPGTPHVEILAAQRARGMYADAEGGAATERAFLAVDRTRPHRTQRTLPDGRRFDIASDPTPDGGFVVSIADVTALARAEAEAERRAGLLRTMLDNNSSGILLYDREHRLAAFNRLAAEMMALPDLDSLVGRHFHEILDLQRARGNLGPGETGEEHWKRLRSLDRRLPHRDRRVTGDGRVLNYASDPTPDGGFVISLTDVTPLARAQQEAAERAAILGVMLGNIRHGIVLFDREGRLVARNDKLLEMLDLPERMMRPGLSEREMVAYMHARGDYGEGPAAEARMAAILARRRDVPHSSVRRRPDGRILEVVSDPTPDGGFVLTYTDVTEDRRIREELEAARAAAEAASLAKSRFLATMSHELRTPLNAVIGFSEVLRADAPPEQTEEFARAIQEAGRHLLSLIDDILDVTRAESGQLPVSLEAVALGPLLAGVERMLRPAAEKAGLSLSLRLPERPPRLRADERRLRQVLINLVNNALKFTPAGGEVSLSLRQGEDGVTIEVADTGIGIAAADLSRVFEPFTQLDSQLARRYPGAGLGLYLCRVLAEAQGASLTLESEPQRGTRALLRFPAASLLPDA